MQLVSRRMCTVKCHVLYMETNSCYPNITDISPSSKTMTNAKITLLFQRGKMIQKRLCTNCCWKDLYFKATAVIFIVF